MSLRLALFYAALFMAAGVQLPFWPVWLAARGMDPQEIGTLLALGGLVRIVASPSIATLADRLGRRKPLVVALAVLSLATTALYAAAQGFAAILAVAMLSAVFYSNMLPMADGLAVLAARARTIDYGRVRLWGSLSFIVTATAGGHLLGRDDAAVILWLVLGALALTVAAAVALPDIRTERAPRRFGWRKLIRDRSFVLVLVTASVLQASHAVYYGFSTLHWRDVGLSETLIGALWAEGVIAEIALFAVSTKLTFGPRGLLLLAAAGGVARWVVLGTTDAVEALIVVQTLHALTFGAAHLAVMRHIMGEVAPEATSTAQGLAAAIGSIFTALFMWSAGLLYAVMDARAYIAMAALSVAGGALAMMVGRVPRTTVVPQN